MTSPSAHGRPGRVDIDPQVARDQHQVSTEHSRMDNGELRFRLKHSDGAAYIRTVAGPEGAWQDSHYHQSVLETYIVQQGWLGYAEPDPQAVSATLKRYGPGAIFTTPPQVIHNIYLPAGAVIHTVKHGTLSGEDRYVDDDTRRFTELTRRIAESEFPATCEPLAASVANPVFSQLPLGTQGEYSEGYRHFDNLIWQVPAWSSAIFAVVLTGAGEIAAENILAKSTGRPMADLLCAFYAATGSFLLILSYALYRFRWHQTAFKNYKARWVSPQLGLQTVVNAQSAIFCTLALSLGGAPLAWALATGLLLLVGSTGYQQMQLVKKAREGSWRAPSPGATASRS